MLDCGLHMGFNDNRKYPDFAKIKIGNNSFTDIVDLVLISHFHLDHCGALPYFTEQVGYEGDIYMTLPTKAILPYMLEDFFKVMSDPQNIASQQQAEENQQKKSHSLQHGQKSKSQSIGYYQQQQIKQQAQTQPQQTQQQKCTIPIYTLEQIEQCQTKIKIINLHETIITNRGIKLKAYYAGHVLGACMFEIEYKGVKVVYTGDFNSSSDRHLGAAWIEKIRPDLLITESTYASTIRDSKRAREREFLQTVQSTIDNGGKVLIPVFALGRAQELCILLETYWQRTNNKVPIYFAAGLIDKANFYYRLFVNWTNEKIKNSFVKNNLFEFKHIFPFQRALMKSSQPMVLLATPGMLHGGLSVQILKEWCQDFKNTLIIPGYCVAGTLGNKLLQGIKHIEIDYKVYNIQMEVKNMSFSAHADAKGILNLIKHVEPKNVMLVHGEKNKMEILSEIISAEFKVPVIFPANFEAKEIKRNNLLVENLKDQVSIAYSENIAKVLQNNDQKMKLELQQNRGFLVKFEGSFIKNKQFKNNDYYSFVTKNEFIRKINDQLEFLNFCFDDNPVQIQSHSITEGYCLSLSSSLSPDLLKEQIKQLINSSFIQLQKEQDLIEEILINLKSKIFIDNENNLLLIHFDNAVSQDLLKLGQKFVNIIKFNSQKQIQ